MEKKKTHNCDKLQIYEAKAIKVATIVVFLREKGMWCDISIQNM